MDSQDDNTRSTHSTALLDVKETKVNIKEKLVFSLLQEKKHTKGTFKIGPSASLQKVKDFLPQLKRANVKLEEEITNNPDQKADYDIENVNVSDGPIIEMDLALYEDSDSDCSSTSSSDLDTETSVGPINENNIKLPGSCLKSNLVEILEDSHNGKEKK